MQPIKSGELSGSAQLVERQMLLWNARQRAHETAEEKAHIYRFITISRDVGSLGDALASGLASHLGWHVYDREIVDYIAQNSHVRQNLVQLFDEKDQNLIHDTVQRLLGMIEGGTFGADDYHEALYKTLVSLGTRGRAIFIGRGANFVLKGHPGLHIRVMASPDVRVERLCLQMSSRVEASTAIWRAAPSALLVILLPMSCSWSSMLIVPGRSVRAF